MTVSIEVQDATAVVRVSGDVDLASSPTMQAAIADACRRPGTAEVVVDLADVPFLDSSGISALLQGRREALGRDLAYHVVGANPMIRSVLELTGVWPLLTTSAE